MNSIQRDTNNLPDLGLNVATLTVFKLSRMSFWSLEPMRGMKSTRLKKKNVSHWKVKEKRIVCCSLQSKTSAVTGLNKGSDWLLRMEIPTIIKQKFYLLFQTCMLSSWQQQQYSPYAFAKKWKQFIVKETSMIHTEITEINVLESLEKKKKKFSYNRNDQLILPRERSKSPFLYFQQRLSL